MDFGADALQQYISVSQLMRVRSDIVWKVV